MDLPADDSVRAEIRQLVDLDGGPVTPHRLGSSLQNEDLLSAVVSLESIVSRLNLVSRANGGPRATLAVTASTSMTASVRIVGDRDAVVLVPIGCVARLQVMHRLLLSNWNREGEPLKMIQSVMDRPRDRSVAPQLTSLLREMDDERVWWDALDGLDATIELDPAFYPDVSELNHLALSMLLSHEFAHVARHHHAVRRRVGTGELSFIVGDGDGRRHADAADLRRAMENDADMVGAYLSTLALIRDADGASLPRGFVRLGYALTALFALFDPQRLSVMDYGEATSYPHPLIRHGNAMDDIRAVARQSGAFDAYEQNVDFGYVKCLEALRWIETDIYLEGRFGGTSMSDAPIIHALRGSASFAWEMADDQGEQRALALRLGSLITEQYGEFQFVR